MPTCELPGGVHGANGFVESQVVEEHFGSAGNGKGKLLARRQVLEKS